MKYFFYDRGCHWYSPLKEHVNWILIWTLEISLVQRKILIEICKMEIRGKSIFKNLKTLNFWIFISFLTSHFCFAVYYQVLGLFPPHEIRRIFINFCIVAFSHDNSYPKNTSKSSNIEHTFTVCMKRSCIVNYSTFLTLKLVMIKTKMFVKKLFLKCQH